MNKDFFHSFFSASLNLIFPPSCPSCTALTGNRGGRLCEDCFARLQFISSPYCSCCGRGFSTGRENHLCVDCLESPWEFDKARSLVLYEEVVAGLIHRLKYTGRLTGLSTFRYLWEQSSVVNDLEVPDIIHPVPLHVKRLRKRGFNQALLLVRELFAEEKERIRFDILARQRDTPSQTNLSGKERRRNLKDSFIVKHPAEILEKKILLLDDVFTTGATANECAKVLKKAGCRKVEVVTICRADKLASWKPAVFNHFSRTYTSR
ncbi:MAG: ComF family protein [Candidatus Electrothrix sp. YB6]